MNQYGVIVQARMSSSRLPGKVLMDVDGKPMLRRQLERLRNGLKCETLVVATSDDSSDDPIQDLCDEIGIGCFRGPLNDVMSRFILCAKHYGIDYLIRVGGDDPLVDWDCCNTLIETHQEHQYDFMYASNRDGWPYGCAAELISRRSLEEIRSKTEESIYLEHTIPYFFDHGNDFDMLRVEAPNELHRPNYYFTVDFPEDFELVKLLFKELNVKGECFSLKEMISYIDQHPEVLKLNSELHVGFER